jgi:hypothetical protein
VFSAVIATVPARTPRTSPVTALTVAVVLSAVANSTVSVVTMSPTAFLTSACTSNAEVGCRVKVPGVRSIQPLGNCTAAEM